MRCIHSFTVFLFLIYFCASNELLAQQSAMFEHPVYFKDGMGNRDTVIIGGDTTVEQGINPEFGEIPITSPFDSVFEVRIISDDEWWKPNPILTKKYIGWSEEVIGFPEICENIQYCRFVIHINHLPLTVYWNSSLYKDSLCILSSYLTSGALAINIGPWTLSLNPQDENLAYCVAQQDSVVLDYGQGLYEGNLYNEFIYPVEGGNEDTMMILQWDFDYFGSTLACGEIVSTDETPFIITSSYKVYPVPATDNLYIEKVIDQLEQVDKIVIYNINGRLMSGYDISDANHKVIQLNINGLSPGIYILKILSDLKFNTIKFIKF